MSWSGSGFFFLNACVGLFVFALGTVLAAGHDGPAATAVHEHYRNTVQNESGLLGYWTLEQDLQAARGALDIQASRTRIKTTEGPFGRPCVDLGDGNDLSIAPTDALNADQLGVEILFRILADEEVRGNPCLLGIRGPEGTRFSLHYVPGDRRWIVWNGSSASSFTGNDLLETGPWYHVAVGFGADGIALWVNGKACKPIGSTAEVPTVTGVPFVMGAAEAGTDVEQAAVAVAHLALYAAPLTREQVLAHVEAAGWSAKTKVRYTWQDCPVSILESQIGYHPRNLKRVYLRSLQPNPPATYCAPEFDVVDTVTRNVVYRDKVEPWGKKWLSYWWVLDFTPVRQTGTFVVRVGELESSPFRIEAGVYHKTDLAVIALNQLEDRIHEPEPGKNGEYHHCPPDVRIYRDCGGPYAELEPVGTCVYALFELYEQLGDAFSEPDRKRMLKLAAMGADYFVAAQRHTDDPETDGMFHHSLLGNTGEAWTCEIFTYLDTAYGMALMARAHQFFEHRDPERAARYLETAKKAWRLCAHRPYHTKADRTLPAGANTYFWNHPPNTQRDQGRAFYNILDENWEMPFDLRTRDRLPVIQGAALLYDITGEQKYLDTAMVFADAVMERQFTDWEHPLEGCFGNFYEFSGNDDVFFHEFMQGGFWWEGNVESMNMEGFMHLLRLAPGHPKSAAWMNSIRTYAEHYARKATTVNPLGIYPVSCYRDPEHGGLKNFQNTLMGSSCVHGFSTKNFMTLGAFLEDADYQLNAIAGVNFIAGLNPGVPNAYEDTAWDARSLILGVGNSWFGPAHPAKSPLGSVPNGFCASSQFWHLSNYVNFISCQPDRPGGMISPGGSLQFNEDWILHSHAYVQGVARIEGRYTLSLDVREDGVGVPARAVFSLRECAAPHTVHTAEYQTADDGSLRINDLPTPCEGHVRLVYRNHERVRPVAAIAGATHKLAVDFACELDVTLQAPGLLVAGERADMEMRVANHGAARVDLTLALSGSGVALERETLRVRLDPGEEQVTRMALQAGAKVMPYLVRVVTGGGRPMRVFTATGKIGSAIE